MEYITEELMGAVEVEDALDAYVDVPPEDLESWQLARKNEWLYRTNRGRVCEIPSCGTVLRYTRPGTLCSIHE